MHEYILSQAMCDRKFNFKASGDNIKYRLLITLTIYADIQLIKSLIEKPLEGFIWTLPQMP